MRFERLLQEQRRNREAKEKDPNLPGSRLSSRPRLAATYASPIIAIPLITPNCTESPSEPQVDLSNVRRHSPRIGRVFSR